MKHTKESLAAMSDFERNESLARLLGLEVVEEQHLNFGDRLESPVIVGEPNNLDAVDYCNDPRDIMPLVFKHKLSVEYVIARDSGYWLVGANTYHHFADENPLRAATCCLILVLQRNDK